MRRIMVVVGLLVLSLAPATQAFAHPLGNFTVNHYDGIGLSPHELVDHAIVDFAEIPTAQARDSVDANSDGHVDAAEAASYAVTMCADVARNVTVVVDGRRAVLVVSASSFAYRPGAAGLSTSRLDCTLTATVDVHARTSVAISDGFDSDRIGWREITATASGAVHLVDSPVPEQSISDELLHYPNDLLSSPLSVRSTSLVALPGAGASTVASHVAGVHRASVVVRSVERVSRLLSSLSGRRHLTVGVGALAVLVSLLLGAAHAALPGHGKTVMAAYLAGKHGSRRDAIAVGATVTLTHTAGVLLLGLALSLSSTLAGEQVTTALGLVSGALIVAVGVGLLTSALRRRRQLQGAHDHDHDSDHHSHGHGHSHGHDHVVGHDHRVDGRSRRRVALIGMGVAGGLVPSPSALVVLLGAVALGRTAFGVALVFAYGVGMAATLTVAGLLLVTAVDRLGSRPRLTALAGRVAALAPATTSVLVVAVGAGLAARSLMALSI